MIISMIAAIGKNRELGKNNKLLWHIKEDFQRFKALTSGSVVIMGRKTYESIGKPLLNRTNIIITRNRNWKAVGGKVCNSFETAIEISNFEIRNSKLPNEIFIIGGAEIYKQGIKYANKLYLTLVDKEFPDADAYFPDYSNFKKVIKEEKKSDGKFTYKFIELEK